MEDVKDAREVGDGGKEREDGEGLAAESAPRVERSRCPFCREDVLSTQDVSACEACLARHHGACWTESRACASCGHVVALTRGAARAGGLRRPVLLLVVVVALALLGVLGVRLRLETNVRQAEAERRSHLQAASELAADATERSEAATRLAQDLVRAERYVLLRTGMELTGLRCGDVRPGTPAASIAERVGRSFEIKSVDGVPVDTTQELARHLEGLSEGATVKFGVRPSLRPDEVVTLTLGPAPKGWSPKE